MRSYHVLAAAALAAASLAPAARPARAAVAPAPPMRWVPAHSSNYSRRSARRPDLIVIHTIEGSEGGGISWFQNPAANVSAHYVVSRTGRVTRMVRDQDVAWHVVGYNERSIGIENEGYASRNRYDGFAKGPRPDLGRLRRMARTTA